MGAMVGNIVIHNATYDGCCGEVDFATSVTCRRYKLTISPSILYLQLQELNLDGTKLKTEQQRKIKTCDLMNILNQDDTILWSWPVFHMMLLGFVAGYQTCKNQRDQILEVLNNHRAVCQTIG